MNKAKTVLIVDDNEHLRRIVGDSLSAWGYSVLEAASGSQAVKTSTLTRPDLILLDLHLPDMKGTDAARAIRNKSGEIPIIGWSAFFDAVWKEAALDAGMVDYLCKPVPLQVIKETVDRFLYTER